MVLRGIAGVAGIAEDRHKRVNSQPIECHDDADAMVSWLRSASRGEMRIPHSHPYVPTTC